MGSTVRTVGEIKGEEALCVQTVTEDSAGARCAPFVTRVLLWGQRWVGGRGVRVHVQSLSSSSSSLSSMPSLSSCSSSSSSVSGISH